ncbi:ATP--guanido phosphotransferase [uncultured Finegoldia sp.]|uniref:ATP--guanido phosphotransferase n=1 Tax=uncultured Finegoldia sp. TaxID=328009 RepID=UPI00262847A4|nr:ATP--guanido phosphotransferase [uncultured Finegoldia sp.]
MNNSSVVVKSMVCMRRNLSNYNFMMVIDTDSCDEMKSDIEKELDSLGYLKDSKVYNIKDTKSTTKDYIKKRGYICSSYYEDVSPVVFINDEKKVVFSLGDNDHVRIIKYDYGRNLRDVYNDCLEIEEKLNDRLNFAFDIDIGYLSDDFMSAGCLTDVDIFLNLKALELYNEIDYISDIAKFRGYTLEKAYDSNTKSSIYKLSTNDFVADCEFAINDLTLLVDSISRKEMDKRKMLIEQNQKFKDELLRSVSMLKYSRVLDEVEAMNKITDLLIAIDFGIVDGYEVDDIVKLFDKTNKLTLEKFRDDNNLNQNIGVLRSEIIKNTLERQVKN